MIKYIVIFAIGFVAYDALMKSSPNKISSTDYKFQVLFPDKPTEITRIIDLATFGKIKLTNYYDYHHWGGCVISPKIYDISNLWTTFNSL